MKRSKKQTRRISLEDMLTSEDIARAFGVPFNLMGGTTTGALPRTTPGEHEDARRWHGSTVYCGKCGAVIDELLALPHRCKPQPKELK